MNFFKTIFLLVWLLCNNLLRAQSFSGVDDLGRVLPQHAEVGGEKLDRHVGIFYFLWQGDPGSPTSEYAWDLEQLYQYHPVVFHDFHHPDWGGGAKGAGKYYFWGEPIYGYYSGDDYWVHVRNMQLLADAKVDFLILDATNRLTYPRQGEVLLKAIESIRKQGKKAPQIVFYTNTASADAMQEIYDTFYAPNARLAYPDSYFHLEGKPLIIGHADDAKGRNYESFFTIRESQWPNEPQKVNGWPWIEFQRPQKVYRNSKGNREIVNVSASQHPNLDASMGGSAFYGMSGNWGRSYRKGSVGNPAKDVAYGYNIQEQWDFALTQNVPFVFITGWNEWIAGKWSREDKKNQAHFVDQANAEYSRDIEPTWTGGLKDNYYMQMIANIRRYKGGEPVVKLTKIKDNHEINDWKSVKPIYTDYIGDILARNHPGAQSMPKTIYTNTTGRNDLQEVKLQATAKEIYFYVNTANSLSERVGENWMTLWLNTDESYASGWNGYDYRVIQGDQLQRFVNGFWENIGKVSFTSTRDELIIKIPYEQIAVFGNVFFIEFKWSDNMQKSDALDWYINGDAAPGGRLNLRILIK